MIEVDVKFSTKIKCSECDKEFEVNDAECNGFMFCYKCETECFNHRFIEAFDKFPQEYEYLWSAKEHKYEDLSEKEEKIFLDGIQSGFCDALFWMADEFGLMSIFEKYETNLLRPLILTKKQVPNEKSEAS